MSRKSFNRHALVASFALALVASAGATAAAQTYSYAPPRTAPPTLIAPVREQLRAAPVVFQWNAGGSVGSVYGIGVTGLRRGAFAIAQSTASYEIQIAEGSPNSPDIGFARVLFDTTTSSTSYLFNNRNVDGSGFTSAVPPGLPLPAGRYYWRVRLQQAGSPFSEPAVFRLLSNGAVGTPTHQLSVENLTLGARPAAQSATLVIASIANTGTFPEPPTDIRVVANGTIIAEGRTPALAPNQRVDLISAWIPTSPGVAQLTATIDASGDRPESGRFVREIAIGRSRAVTTSLVGTIREGEGGDFTLEDAAGHVLAVVIAKRNIDLGAFVGRRVTVRGALTEGALGLQLNAAGVAPG
jgi:hypothetical protein